MKKLLLIFITSILINSFYIFANNADSILLTINDEKITKSEFLRIYSKNNENVYDSKTVDEYMELFINFKLKVIEAERLGLDTTETFVNEFNGYKKQLEEPYLELKEIDDILLNEAYSRLQKEFNISHILIQCNRNQAPEDTLEAYNKALEIRERIVKGEDFEVIARATSEDPSVKQNGGNLGNFTALQLLYPFENAAYNLPVGEISMPVRTRYGYHIIKVNNRRDANGEVKVAHIMIVTPKDISEDSLKSAKERADKIYQKIQNGEDFGELAKMYSDDKKSGRNKGELSWFGVGRMVPPFENAAFALKNIGDVSPVIQTQFGYHIIKLLDRKGIAPLEQIKDDLMKRIQKDSRSSKKNIAFINHLKQEYNFTVDSAAKADLFNAIDTNFYSGNLELNKDEFSNILIKFDNVEITQYDFFNELASRKQKFKKWVPISVFLDKEFEKYTSNILKEFERSKLSEKYPEFKYLLEEYHDGILLFELTDSMVWSKAVIDTIGLKNYYNKNVNNYMWDERVLATKYYCNNMETAEKVKGMINKYLKKKKEVDKNTILSKINTDTVLLTIETKKYAKNQDIIIDSLKWKPGVSDIIKDKDKIFIVQIEQLINPEPKTIDEARGLIIADYQNFLEEKWIAELRNKYNIEINNEVLETIKN